MTGKQNTEDKIVMAAREVFQQKGYDGARMQEIADHAEINKGLLHYYFKSKDKLFEKVFGIAFEAIFEKISQILNADVPIFEKIEGFIHNYLKIVSRNMYLPRFVINELGKNPDQFVNSMIAKKGKPHIRPFIDQIEAGIQEGILKPIDPRHLLTNMVSLCVFPILAQPVLQVMLDLDKPAYMAFIEERKTQVTQFIINAIKA